MQPVPFRFYNSVILGVLPAGSEFQIKKVKYEGSVSGAYVYYYAAVTSSTAAEWVGKEMNTTWLAQRPKNLPSGEDGPPVFKPELVEEIPAAGK